MGIIKGFTFDGVNSLDYNIGITGSAVYNAPTRDVEMISIPGRDGEYALDHGRFNNIEITYPSGMGDNDQTNFAQRVSDLRNQLASRVGYKRLEDEYNPDEYRMAIYKSGLEVSPVQYSRAGQFDIIFDCKPQRFLFSGEEVFTLGEWGQTETKSGSIVSFEGDETTAIKSLTAQIVPKQSGSGDPSPSNVRPISGYNTVGVTRAGKNLVNSTISSQTINGITVTVNNGVITLNGTASSQVALVVGTARVLKGRNYIISGMPSTSASNKYFLNLIPSPTTGGSDANYYTPMTITPVSDLTETIRIYVRSGQTVNNLVFEPMIRLATETDSTYKPYNGSTITTNLPQTVYGGTLDVVSGVLTIDKVGLTFNGSEDWWTNANVDYFGLSNVPNSYDNNDRTQIANWLVGGGSGYTTFGSYRTQTNGVVAVGNNESGSKHWDSVATFKTYLQSHNLTIVYKVQTPTEITLTPTEVNTLLGSNNIWADSGDVTVEIGQNPYILVNPTLFDAHPLISFNASGDGTITIGDKSLNFYNKPLGVIPLPYVVYNYRPTGNYYCLDLVTFDENTPHNTGDTFTFVGAKATLTIQSETEISSVYFVTGQALRYIPGGGGVSGNTATITLEDWQESSFVFGTAKTVTKSVEWRIVVGGTAQTQTITLELIYGGANTVRVRWSATLTSGVTISSGSSSANYVANVDSTANSLTGDLYIDLDIGEAYRIENGSVVSINNFVNLGGELPTLPPGNTTITYDNTISNFKITPRWWKI